MINSVAKCLLIVLLPAFFFSCSKKSGKVQLVFSGSFFDREQVDIVVNDKVVLSKKVAVKDTFPDTRVKDEFIIEDWDSLYIHFHASRDDIVTIDTTFYLMPVDSIYYLFVSAPMPFDWEYRMSQDPPLALGRWSMDSSTRFISFKGFSEYKADFPMWGVDY